MAECAICKRSVHPRTWVCRECEQVWGLRKPFSEWPEWVKALRLEEERYRLGDELAVCLSDVDVPLESLTRPQRLRTRPDDDMADGLPLDPYDDIELNRQYQWANYL